MPNQKSSKGKKSKRTNSSGDEQENGACAAAAGGAAAAPRTDRSSEVQCATPLGCSFGNTIDLEKDEYQRVFCNNELCPYGNWMHLQCFYEWESSILIQFNCIGRARSWNEKQCRQNMWTKKGYDLAFRFCSCRCGQGHLKKDTDWYQVKRMQDERKKKPCEKSAGRSGSSGGGAGSGDGLFEEPKKSKPAGAGKLAQRASSQELPRRQSVERQNSAERGVSAAGHGIGGASPLGPPQKSPCDSPGQSPPTGFSFSPTTSLGSGGAAAGLRGSRQLGEFLKSAVHMDAQRKQMLIGGALSQAGGSSVGASGGVAGCPQLDSGSVLPLSLSFALPLHHQLTSNSVTDGIHSHPVQFLRRLDLSELLTHIPRHKLNTYHVRMEDDAQAGQGEELRRFILSALSASQRNVVHCALCHRVLPVFEQFPLVDGTLFLSPSRHEEIEYDVPCHLQEGVHKIVCIKCKSRWDGSWHQLGTMYTYDILAASPCCQARLNCKHCGKPVVDVRVGMQYFSEYSNVQQCPHCGNLDYHFVKPFSSYKVLEAY
ncbi:headcase protein homolog isoform X2 [Thalassophryne amazonica]|uniref:headcase protein homolog isoform X2 n=1 Tax=Thalassophryne amazonica TaxID=390379 RepID=UPI00147102F4|nr:headcase protein homolog isoform X2 [Thalassophryne amazonica]